MMKNLSLVGFILLLISAVLFYMTTGFVMDEFKLSHVMGILAGIGIGLIIGGIVGYVSKGSKVKEVERRKELERLNQEKLELEKQAAELAEQQIIKNDPQKTQTF